jgi:ankyrin repeat protein
MPPSDLLKQILLDLQIDDAIPDAYNIALQVAAGNGRVDLVKLLLKVDGINPNFAEGHSESPPLILAAENGHSDVVQLLLEIEGIDVNLRDRLGRTAFYQAVCRNKSQVVELLLKRDDIDPNLPDNEGRTALYCAFKNSDYEMVDLFLKHGKVDHNARASKGYDTPFTCAIICRPDTVID